MSDVIDLIANGKIRSFFRARNKFSFEGAIAHITQHAPGTEPLFLEESDYLYMLYLIKNMSGRFRVDMLGFVLMSNHIHLLVKLAESNLPSAMKSLFQTYALYFNRKYDRKGHVFCGAYRSALCFDENYLLAASLYIHLNPVRANLVSNPLDYRWSSCGLFLNNATKETFVDYNSVLAILSEDISMARRKYREIINNQKLRKIDNVSNQPKALEYTVEALREILESHEGLDKKIIELKDSKRLKKPEGLEARKFMIEQLKARGYNVADIAKKLNLSRTAIYKTLNLTKHAMTEV